MWRPATGDALGIVLQQRLSTLLARCLGGAWPAYIEVRITSAARTIGRLLAAGQKPGSGWWSERELVSAVEQLIWARRDANQKLFIPGGDDVEEAVKRKATEWDWGLTTVQRLGDMTVDVLKRAVWLAPIDSLWQKAIVEARNKVNLRLDDVRGDRRKLDDFWLNAPTREKDPIPPRGVVVNLDTPTERAATDLMEWLNRVLVEWDQVAVPIDRRKNLPDPDERENDDDHPDPNGTDRRSAYFRQA